MTHLRTAIDAMKRHPALTVAGVAAVAMLLAALLLPTWLLVALLALGFLVVIGSGGRRLVAELIPGAFAFAALAVGIAAFASLAAEHGSTAPAGQTATPSPSSTVMGIDTSVRCVDDKAALTANHPVAGMCDSPFEYDQSACDAYPAGTVLLHVGRAVTYRPSGYWTNGVWYCVRPDGLKVQL